MDTYHLQGPAQHAAQDIREPQLVLRPPIVRKLDKVRQRVLVEYQRELLAVARPVRDRRRDVQEYLEPDL